MNISAYLEYTSIEAYLPSLLDDISPFPFVEDVLIQRHLNMWFGNGYFLFCYFIFFIFLSLFFYFYFNFILFHFLFVYFTSFIF